MSRSYGFLALALSLGLGSAAWGQQVAPARPAAAPAAAVDVKAATADEQLAAVMLANCRNEIELAIFAKPLLQSQAAKDFADKLMQDHQATCDKLEKIAGSHARPAKVAAAPPTEQKATFAIGKLKLEASSVRPRAEGEAARAASPLNWIAIHEEFGDECLAAAKAQLQKNEGDADKIFLGQQIAEHMAMVARLKVFHKYASTNLRNVIDSDREMAEAHLKQALSIHFEDKSK